MEDLKILEVDYTGLDVMGMEDSPTSAGWTADQIQERFDALVKELMAVRLNALIDALVASTGTSGAEEIGSLAISGVTGTTVHDQLSDLKTQIDEAVISGLTEDTITDVYLSGTEGNIKPSFAAHIVNYLLHIGNAGTTGGSGSAYTATLSDFDDEIVNFFILTVHTGCSNDATLALNGGAAHQIVALGNTNIKAGHMKTSGVYLIVYNPTTSRYVLINPDQTNLHTHAVSAITNLQTSLDAKQGTITGGASLITTSNLTTNRALVSNSSGKVAVSAVTSTELGYMDGVTSSVQTQIGSLQSQINTKFPTANIIYSSSTPSYTAGKIWLKPIT